jgi:ABC-type branched-subunit amino acid transport system ATPase component
MLILDEPFAGLKTTIIERVLDVLRAEAQGKVVVVIDHTLSAIRAVASGIWFMDRGRLTVFRDYSEMAASEVFGSTYLGAGGLDDQPFVQTKSGTLVKPDHRRAIRGSDSALALHNVSAGYGNKVVIRQVNLEVLSGDVVCVIGLNGSGKSTLLRAIVGLARLFEGHVYAFGKCVDGTPCDARVRMGMRVLVQDHRLFRDLTLPDNLLLSAAAIEPVRRRLWGLPFNATRAALSSVAAKQRVLESAIPTFDGRPARTYSGGEQARVALAQIDCGNPRLVLLDEPTSGIDGLAVHSLFAAIRDWQQRPLPIVIVEHNLDFVATVATKVLLLSDGALTELPFRPGVSAAELFRIFTEAVHFDTNTFRGER